MIVDFFLAAQVAGFARRAGEKFSDAGCFRLGLGRSDPLGKDDHLHWTFRDRFGKLEVKGVVGGNLSVELDGLHREGLPVNIEVADYCSRVPYRGVE